jgi:hypothetical protein
MRGRLLAFQFEQLSQFRCMLLLSCQGLKACYTPFRSSSVFWLFGRNHFTEKGLFVYLSGFLEIAIF